MYLYNHLESIADSQRDPFQQTAVNALHYHSVLVEEIETLDGAGVQILADEQGLEQIFGSFSDLPGNVAKLDYNNIAIVHYPAIGSRLLRRRGPINPPVSSPLHV